MAKKSDFLSQASKARTASASADYKGEYDPEADTITILISNVSESFVPSKSSDNEVIHVDIDLMSSLKFSGNAILVK